MTETSMRRAYRFGPFQLDVRERRLSRGSDVIPLRLKAFETLRMLVENAGRLVTKEELLTAVWPDTTVEENNLNHNVSVLRKALGEKSSGQQFIETVPRVGYRFSAAVEIAEPRPDAPLGSAAETSVQRRTVQRVRYLRTADGLQLAWAEAGTGPVLVKAANWLTHLEYEWESPVWRHWIRFFAEHFRFLRYDERGCGMTDRRLGELSFERWVEDLEAVVDAAGIEGRLTLLGISQGASVCVAYAAKHPERVSGLLLYGAYARGWSRRGDPDGEREYQAITELVRRGWGRDNPAFRQVFTSRFMPGASGEQIEWFNELCRKTATADVAAALLERRSHIDVTELLGKVQAPTLVIHGREDVVCPVAEGRLLASGIRGAQFVELDSANHILLESEPAWGRFCEAVLDFRGLATAGGRRANP